MKNRQPAHLFDRHPPDGPNSGQIPPAPPRTIEAGHPLQGFHHVFICDQVSPSAGGIQNMMYWIAHGLADRGLRVVVAGRQDQEACRHLAQAGIELYRLNNPPHTKNSRDLRLLKLILQLRLRYGTAVILYVPLIKNVKVYRWLSRWLRWRCVSYIHGNEVLRLVHKKPVQLQKNLAACACVFASSEYTKNLTGRLPAKTANVHALAPGIPAGEFLRKLQQPDSGYRQRQGWHDKQVVLMLSRLVRRKGHETAIAAIARLVGKYPSLRLVIGGGGIYQDTIQAMIERYGVTANVELLGFVAEQDKLNLYQACDIYCMPSEICEESYEVEGFGISFLEAAAMGKYVIGSESGGIPESIERNRSGFLITPGAVDQLAGILDDLLGDPARYAAIRSYAQTRALTRFDWDSRVHRMLSHITAAVL
jgi:glycosyltransferase involved in cell wall biosynthesis